MKKTIWGIALAGTLAGAANGLFGGGGGMILVPVLGLLGALKEKEVFPASVTIILPVCIVSLLVNFQKVPLGQTACFLVGSAVGGILAGSLGRRIPVKWLHRGLGILILWGGIRYLC